MKNKYKWIQTAVVFKTICIYNWIYIVYLYKRISPLLTPWCQFHPCLNFALFYFLLKHFSIEVKKPLWNRITLKFLNRLHRDILHYIRLDKINELSFRSALLQVSFKLGLNDYRPISYLGFFQLCVGKFWFLLQELYIINTYRKSIWFSTD